MRNEFRTAGGSLTPLQFAGQESQWIVGAFGKQGVAVGTLLRADATEANARANLPGRRIVHFACHGIVDAAHGNLFGALALTPGLRAATDPADDGFLSLPEIYEQDLAGCELAILSACHTNYGPQLKGEGTWALSRGFLVAGARRVVASNWLVDDEAAASAMSYFCSGLAKQERGGQLVRYAESLRNARRWVRQQEKWKSPFYWGTFVMVGPG